MQDKKTEILNKALELTLNHGKCLLTHEQIGLDLGGLDTYETFDDLSGKKVAVQQGTTGDLSVTEGDEKCVVKGVDVKRMNKGADAVVDLMNGGVDAVVIDALPAEQFVKAHSDELKVVVDEAVVEEYAIAMPKGQEELKEAVNKALADIKADGTLDQLAEQYDAK